MPTYRNDRDGRTVTVDEEPEALVRELLARGQANHWCFFYLARDLQRLRDEEARRAYVAPAPAPRQPRVEMRGAHAFLADQFLLAQGYGLRRPRIRVHWLAERFKIYLSRRGNVCFKAGMLNITEALRDPTGGERFIGMLSGGQFVSVTEFREPREMPTWQRRQRQQLPLTPIEELFVGKLAKEPNAFLEQCSKDMDACCYCGMPLEDSRSKAVGYGGTCAKRFGRPWGEGSASEKAPSFASVWDDKVHANFDLIRSDLYAVEPWAFLNDELQMRGMPPLEIVKQGDDGAWFLDLERDLVAANGEDD